MSAEQIKAWKAAIAEHNRQQRRQRWKRPGPQITGIMVPMPQLARCTEPACPYRWRTGRDRPCPDHERDHGTGDLAEAAKALGIELAPGDRGADDGAQDGAQ